MTRTERKFGQQQERKLRGKWTDLLDGTLSGQGQLEQDTACPSILLFPRNPP